MIVTINQPRYLPWLGYFHRIAVSDLFIYLDSVQYARSDWENRNRIKTGQGPKWLTVPVKAEHGTMIPEVTIDNDQPWQTKHWKTIFQSYSKAPFFPRYEAALSSIYRDGTWSRLIDLNLESTQTLCGLLGLNQARFARASEIGARGKGSELILNLCTAVGAKVYLSGSQGRNYLDEDGFRRAGIRVVYQDYVHPQYPQLFGDFVPFMAVPDLLFNCGPRSLEILLAGQQEVV